jgi:hypothetical protein
MSQRVSAREFASEPEKMRKLTMEISGLWKELMQKYNNKSSCLYFLH